MISFVGWCMYSCYVTSYFVFVPCLLCCPSVIHMHFHPSVPSYHCSCPSTSTPCPLLYVSSKDLSVLPTPPPSWSSLCLRPLTHPCANHITTPIVIWADPPGFAGVRRKFSLPLRLIVTISRVKETWCLVKHADGDKGFLGDWRWWKNERWLWNMRGIEVCYTRSEKKERSVVLTSHVLRL